MARIILMCSLMAYLLGSTSACRPAAPPSEPTRATPSAVPARPTSSAGDAVLDQPVEVRDAQGRVILSLERVGGELRRVERAYDEQGNLLRAVTPAHAVNGQP